MWRLALVALLLLPLAVEAKGKRNPPGAYWAKKRVPVYDYTPDEWKPVVAQVVADFNAVMPPRVPRLAYERMPEQSCRSLDAQSGAIVVCTDRTMGSGGVVSNRIKRGAFVSSLVRLWAGEQPTLRRWTICHEMMHALTDVPDNRVDYAHEHTSCVQGTLETPGSWDVAFAERVYAKRKHR